MAGNGDIYHSYRAALASQNIAYEGMLYRQVVEELLYGMGLQLMEEHPVSYECKCSRKKVESALISMGREELQKLIVDDDSLYEDEAEAAGSPPLFRSSLIFPRRNHP